MPQIDPKWPKIGFFAFGHRTQECSSFKCIDERCACARRTQGLNIVDTTGCIRPSFLTKTIKRLYSVEIPNNRIRIDISAIRSNRRTILAALESDRLHGLGAVSMFTIVRRVYILRIQRCGTYIN